jgi:hypothetical protein
MCFTARTSIAVFLFVVAAGPSARADVVTDWNAIMVVTVNGQNPFAQGRIAAIMHLAVFQAVNAVSGEYEPYQGDSPTALSPASADAAAIAAAHRVLVNYVPASAAALDQARAASLAAIPDSIDKTNGLTLGELAAAALIALRSADGSAPPQFYVPPSAERGQWQTTPLCPPAGGVLAHWRQVTPFGIAAADQFRSSRPPRLSSGRYARDFNEVKEAGALHSATRPAQKTDIARFYNAVLAVGTWNPAVAQVVVQQQRSLTFNARVFALLNMAISDALVAVMDTKYAYAFWRPETAIHHGDQDGNRGTEADPSWEPLIPAPCFPSYGSAHAAASYAARHVAQSILGDDEVQISLSSPALPGLTLEYVDLEEITDDIDDARVYGGIHFRFDQRAGARQGRKIGHWIVRHHLRPMR